MAYDIGWIIPRLRNPGTLWNCASSITVAVVGLFSKIIIEFLNKTSVYNKEGLSRAVLHRPPGVPLLTVSNHHSCFDDPGLWGVLEPRALLVARRMRWSLAAHDICFTRALHACFFALGKCVPVVRGAGVYQPAIDFCIERLQKGEWVHIFPEGRVNVDKENIRFKWGVGRMVWECARGGCPPLVVPVWHAGLDHVLPNKEPYLLQFRKTATLHVGEPIHLDRLLHRLKTSGASEETSRAAITAFIQDQLMRLRAAATDTAYKSELVQEPSIGANHLHTQTEAPSQNRSEDAGDGRDSRDAGDARNGNLRQKDKRKTDPTKEL